MHRRVCRLKRERCGDFLKKVPTPPKTFKEGIGALALTTTPIPVWERACAVPKNSSRKKWGPLPQLLHLVRFATNVCFLRLPLVLARRGEIREKYIFHIFSYSLTLRGKPRAFGVLSLCSFFLIQERTNQESELKGLMPLRNPQKLLLWHICRSW